MGLMDEWDKEFKRRAATPGDGVDDFPWVETARLPSGGRAATRGRGAGCLWREGK
jgi:hypothetical protein